MWAGLPRSSRYAAGNYPACPQLPRRLQLTFPRPEPRSWVPSPGVLVSFRQSPCGSKERGGWKAAWAWPSLGAWLGLEAEPATLRCRALQSSRRGGSVQDRATHGAVGAPRPWALRNSEGKSAREPVSLSARGSTTGEVGWMAAEGSVPRLVSQES